MKCTWGSLLQSRNVFFNKTKTVAHILNKLADGFNSEELLEMYPNLELNHIRAAITYAASLVSNEESIAAA